MPVAIEGSRFSVWLEDRRVRASGRLFLVRLTVFVAMMVASAVLSGVVALPVAIQLLLEG